MANTGVVTELVTNKGTRIGEIEVTEAVGIAEVKLRLDGAWTLGELDQPFGAREYTHVVITR
jgi:hypothetical protein